MELTQTNKERLVKLVNKFIEAYHKRNKKDTRNFMYEYAVSDNGTIYCIHHYSKNISDDIVLESNIDIISKDLALLSYFIQDIIDKAFN